jgi:Domain of unknown function (DUF1996)
MKPYYKAICLSLLAKVLILFLAACNTPTQPTQDVLNSQATFTKCANEYDACEFTGTREVRFGDDTNYVAKKHFDFVSCKSQYFGNADPNPGRPKTCKVSSVMVTTPLRNPMPGMDSAAANLNVPVGHPGFADSRVRSTTEQPRNYDNSGAFRVSCEYSHMNFDDPIVYPRQAGKAHLHTFFGNKNTNAFSTPDSVASSGTSTCAGGTANRSSYWVPTLLDKNGQPVVPIDGQFYYKTGYNNGALTPASIKPFPAGLRMIAGNMTSSSPQDSNKLKWICLGTNGAPDKNFSYIPSLSECNNSKRQFKQVIVFPQCWNGRDLDSRDHKSHMAYPVNGSCPSTHPVGLSEITFNIFYQMPSTGTTGWRLSSDMYSTSQRGGYSSHGDWINGWNSTIMNLWVKNCNNAAKDCEMGLLGGGKFLEGRVY